MTFYRKSGGSNVAPSTVKRRSGSAWADVQTIKRRSGGAWVTVWTAYTPITAVTVSGDTSFFWPNKGTTLTASANGSNSASYSWTKLSGSSFLTITSTSNSASVVIGTSRPNSGFTADSAVFRCTASDGTSSAHVDVTVTSNGLN